tara:strand:- start:494 stop:871 length:378 start_codon:yes stop_codon:yes gene_type:complete
MAALSNSSRQRGSWLIGCSVLMMVAALGTGWLLWQAVTLSSLTVVKEHVDDVKPLLSAWRLGIILLVATLWPWVRSALSRNVQTGPSRAESNHLRWRVVGWLLVIELLIGQNLLGQLIQILGGTS